MELSAKELGAKLAALNAQANAAMSLKDYQAAWLAVLESEKALQAELDAAETGLKVDWMRLLQRFDLRVK